MIKWSYFPKTQKITDPLLSIVKVFELNETRITSSTHALHSNAVLKILEPGLSGLNYDVEKGKKQNDKIRVPVLYGENGVPQLSFEVDAYNEYHKIVIEIEAGRALTNYQFLKDFYESCCMNNVDYLCIAVRQIYNKTFDYQKICTFFDNMYQSSRFSIPLKGILIIGY